MSVGNSGLTSADSWAELTAELKVRPTVGWLARKMAGNSVYMWVAQLAPSMAEMKAGQTESTRAELLVKQWAALKGERTVVMTAESTGQTMAWLLAGEKAHSRVGSRAEQMAVHSA